MERKDEYVCESALNSNIPLVEVALERSIFVLIQHIIYLQECSPRTFQARFWELWIINTIPAK